MRPGRIQRHAHDYSRHGATDLFAALEVATGRVLNLVERWFAALTEKQLRRGVHRSTRGLEQAILRYIQSTNGQPKPFVWLFGNTPFPSSRGPREKPATIGRRA